MHKLTVLFFMLCFVASDIFAEQKRWLHAWKIEESLNIDRAGSALVKVGKFIYMLGGVDGRQFLKSVEMTKILEDGRLAPWILTSSLVEKRGFFSAVESNGYIYAVAGGNGNYGKNLLRSIERSKINADGSLGRWEILTSQLLFPRRCVKLIIQGERLYALGGYSGVLLDSIESAIILEDGSLSAWRLEKSSMTMPRYVNAVKKIGDIAYVMGGHRETGGVGLKSVEMAVISEQGITSIWKATSALEYGRYGLAAVSNGQYLWAVGGLNGAIYSDKVEKIQLTNSEMLNADVNSWKETTSLSSPRANFSATVENGWMYIIGGSNRNGYFNGVESAQINAQGDLGFYATAQQKEDYQQRNNNKKIAELPNSGKIIEISRTDAYSYLKVESTLGLIWLAAPLAIYKQSEEIKFSRGLMMYNFFSRSLSRTFNKILFVERVEKL